jgi:hypothetical protein
VRIVAPGLYSIVKFSPDTDRKDQEPLGVVLASDSARYIGSLFISDFRGIPQKYRLAVREVTKNLEGMFTVPHLKEVGQRPEDFLNQMWHDLGNAVFLSEPEKDPFPDLGPRESLQELFFKLVGPSDSDDHRKGPRASKKR